MEGSVHPQGIVILDFGGQYAHLIGSRVRRFGAWSEIREPSTPAEKLRGAAGIILSGGPQSVYEPGSPQADPAIFDLGIPVLGLCYGLHWMTHVLGGEVKPGKVKEYGRTPIRVIGSSEILKDCGQSCTVWMSHGDEAATLPPGFSLIATSDACKHAAFADEKRKFYALQFHPEVTHTEHGFDMLRRFVALCDPAPWSVENASAAIGEAVRREVGDRNVFLLVSGGVDSSVAFVLLNDVLGADRVQGLMVDTGLMRMNETAMIRDAFAALGITNLRIEDASDEFFAALHGITEPEAKRKAIGDTFLAVQKRVAEEMGLTSEAGWMLGQGTIYPDTIETGATKHADKIKTHHNRVEAIERMIEQGLVVEPLKDLYKDEVRKLGEELGLPRELVWRHPFPGPGLGVRILCASQQDVAEEQDQEWRDIEMEKWRNEETYAVLPIRSVGVQGDGRSYRHAVALFSEDETFIVEKEHIRLATFIPNMSSHFNRVLLCTSHREQQKFHLSAMELTRERADLLRRADAIVDEEVRRASLYDAIWQFPVVLLPVGTTPGGQSIVLRPISSIDAMTANAYVLPHEVLERMTKRIVELPGIDAVLLDLTNKPPGTIEWE